MLLRLLLFIPLIISCVSKHDSTQLINQLEISNSYEIEFFDKPQNIVRSFYYWKSDDFTWEEENLNFLKKLEVEKLYVKFFEVEPNASFKAIPIDKTVLNMNAEKKYEIVPTVYVQNEVFLNYKNNELEELAENILYLINKRINSNFNRNQVKEIQIDCDWTKSTRIKYFMLLKELRSSSYFRFSCTLRLYPYKYRESMGVPPVDRVMLMCYNLKNPLQDKTINTILDYHEFEKYVIDEKYPIPMDFAFPIFEYRQLYRNERFQGMIYSEEFKFKDITKSLSKLWYKVQHDTIIDNVWYKKGDKIKWEKVDKDDIYNVMNLIKSKMNFDEKTSISFFHLDERIIENNKYEDLDYLYRHFEY